MRLISQDGEMNFPYEYTVVMREENTILAFTVESPFHRLIATYSSAEIAKMAMCKLNNHDMRHCTCYRMPTEEELCASWRPSPRDRRGTVIS